MYVTLPLILALALYTVALVVLAKKKARRQAVATLTVVAVAAFGVILVAFTLMSNTMGVDVGPGRAVSYSIPGDYIARGTIGVVTLAVLLLAGLSPLLGLRIALGGKR